MQNMERPFVAPIMGGSKSGASSPPEHRNPSYNPISRRVCNLQCTWGMRKRLPRNACGMGIDKTLTSEKRSLQQIVLEAEVPVLVMVSSQSCGPCAAMLPVLAALQEKWGDGLRILKLEGESHPQFMDEFLISGFPSLLLFQRGRVVWSRRGYTSMKMLEQMVKIHRSE